MHSDAQWEQRSGSEGGEDAKFVSQTLTCINEWMVAVTDTGKSGLRSGSLHSFPGVSRKNTAGVMVTRCSS